MKYLLIAVTVSHWLLIFSCLFYFYFRGLDIDELSRTILVLIPFTIFYNECLLRRYRIFKDWTVHYYFAKHTFPLVCIILHFGLTMVGVSIKALAPQVFSFREMIIYILIFECALILFLINFGQGVRQATQKINPK